ncbi:MAG: NAD(P)-dependent oxidoreductase [Phycisphaerae bacterium]|nr:NAD(P)-dependent oxidoreductase [Phycisphaerae bacterium]
MPLTEADLNHILNQTAPLWPEAKNKRFFITGGTGFIGKWLLESFAYINRKLDLNCRMTALSRSPEQFFQQYPHFQQFGEITLQKDDVRNFEFPGEQFDYIIHAAAQASATLNADKPLEMMDTIIGGTRRTLDFARQSGAKRFLFLSSGAVYGKKPTDIPAIPESYNGAPCPLDTLSAYGQAKRASELLCSIYHKQFGLETSIARCFAFVGPYLDLNIHYAIGNFIRDALKGGPIIVNGDGTPTRSYLYAADLAIWLWTMLFKGIPATAYNAGSDIPISIADLAHKIAGLAPQKCGVEIAKKPDQITERQQYIPCIDKAKKELNLKCSINLDDAIKKTISFYRNNI